jgi:hypothetical protein
MTAFFLVTSVETSNFTSRIHEDSFETVLINFFAFMMSATKIPTQKDTRFCIICSSSMYCRRQIIDISVERVCFLPIPTASHEMASVCVSCEVQTGFYISQETEFFDGTLRVPLPSYTPLCLTLRAKSLLSQIASFVTSSNDVSLKCCCLSR